MPFPLSAADRQAGFAPRLSITQMEYSLTQILDRPVHGREFFEEVIRENLDLGRPDRVQLLFERKVTRATPGKLATRVMALLMALCLFLTLPAGFSNRQLRQCVAQLLGLDLEQYKPGQMTYDLRRLRLKGFICRKAGTHAYELTPYGRHTSLFLTRLYQRALRPGLAAASEPPGKVQPPHPLRDTLARLDAQIAQILQDAHLNN